MSAAVRLLLGVAAIALALPATASAQVVECGDVITVDTRLEHDLVCPTPVALEIGAHGVDLDLAGHTVEAVAFLDESGITYEEGIGLLNLGFDDVTVTNGSIIGHESLGYGVRAVDADRLSLRRVSTSGYGSLIVSGDAVRLRAVEAHGFASTITSDGARIDGLTTDTELDVYGQAVDVRNGNFTNFAFFHLDGSSVRDNAINDGHLDGSGNAILDNVADSWFLGDGGGNLVRGNRITRHLSLNAGFSGNLVSRNVVGTVGAPFPAADAISVAAGATGNVLLANTATGAVDDGIDVEEPTTTLIRNRAFGNGDFGIEAVTGVIDGGGNRAWDNGNPLQCLNVDCG